MMWLYIFGWGGIGQSYLEYLIPLASIHSHNLHVIDHQLQFILLTSFSLIIFLRYCNINLSEKQVGFWHCVFWAMYVLLTFGIFRIKPILKLFSVLLRFYPPSLVDRFRFVSKYTSKSRMDMGDV